MKIQEAAKLSGLPADTIRFYERRGVLPRPPRRRNGYREYGDEHLVTLRLASALRGLDVPLERLEGVLQVAHDGTCHELRDTMLETLAKTWWTTSISGQRSFGRGLSAPRDGDPGALRAGLSGALRAFPAGSRSLLAPRPHR